jgi:hypothetical protein
MFLLNSYKTLFIFYIAILFVAFIYQLFFEKNFVYEGFDNNVKIHLVIYSNNEPYNTSKKLTIESLKHNPNIIIHNYDLNKIKNKEWFYNIENLINYNKDGKRDGYYNAWKPFIVKEVYDEMNNDDILYYVDSSQYFIEGFTESIDKIIKIVDKKGIIAGSIGNDINNLDNNTCNNIDIWNLIIPNKNNYDLLYKKHVLNSWFIIKKNNINKQFINEWVYYTTYKSNIFTDPLITYHHTVDQSIFNILVNKYDLPVFYNENITHNENKDKNLVLKIINNDKDYEKYFISL